MIFDSQPTYSTKFRVSCTKAMVGTYFNYINKSLSMKYNLTRIIEKEVQNTYVCLSEKTSNEINSIVILS